MKSKLQVVRDEAATKHTLYMTEVAKPEALSPDSNATIKEATVAIDGLTKDLDSI